MEFPISNPLGYLFALNTQTVTPLSEHLTLGRGSLGLTPNNEEALAERHARIEKRGTTLVVRDLNSQSGTFVNSTRVVEAFLNDQDRLRLGQMEFIYLTQPPATPNGTPTRSPQWASELRQMPSAARTELPILICGESGTGKDILAREIHNLSPRSQGPFHSVNCGALSESLIESELFGHLKGSFTGATEDRKGAFEAARFGTLFLDEIADLPLSLQAKLLRALENREIRPVGSDKVIKTNVRVIAATHQNLKAKVKRGEFRLDLFYRLNVVRFCPPPLRARKEDFESLVFHFCKEMRISFSHLAIEEMKEYHWPGNIRELKNTIARATALFPGQRIEARQLHYLIDRDFNPPAPSTLSASSSIEATSAKTEGGSSLPVIKEMEKEMIIESLIAHQGNQRRAAAELRIPKSTLHDRIKWYQIDIDALLKGQM